MMRSDNGKWEDFRCNTRLKSICEKPAKNSLPDSGSQIDACQDPSCCNGHLGLEWGGKVLDSSFSASSEYSWNTQVSKKLNKVQFFKIKMRVIRCF